MAATMRMKAPITMRMVWTKSVQMTADSPPPIVKIAAMTRRTKMDK